MPWQGTAVSRSMRDGHSSSVPEIRNRDRVAGGSIVPAPHVYGVPLCRREPLVKERIAGTKPRLLSVRRDFIDDDAVANRMTRRDVRDHCAGAHRAIGIDAGVNNRQRADEGSNRGSQSLWPSLGNGR